MEAVLGFAFLIGGILLINRGLQFLWRPFGEPPRVDDDSDAIEPGFAYKRDVRDLLD